MNLSVRANATKSGLESTAAVRRYRLVWATRIDRA